MKRRNEMTNLADDLRKLQANIEIIDDDSEPEPICETCRGLGQIKIYIDLAADIPVSEHRPCPDCERGADFQRQILDNRLQRTKLPQRYEAANLDTWRQDIDMQKKLLGFLATKSFASHPRHIISSISLAQSAIEIVGDESPDWLTTMLDQPDDRRTGLVLYGDYGVGKTWLAAAAMNHMLGQGEYVLYMRMSRLIQTLRDTWKSDDQTGKLLDHYCDVPILFIDDMSDNTQPGTALSPHQQDFAATIMRSRMGDAMPTIITTNWEPNIFEHKWGKVCTDVMLEGCHWIKMAGAKLRDTNADWGEL